MLRFQWSPLLLICGVCICAFAAGPKEPHAFSLQGDLQGAHDPSIIREGKTYYVFTTGRAPGGGQFAVRCSEDLTHWSICGHVFDAVPQWIRERSPKTRDLWAPDISYEKGEYRLYYAYSVFGRNTSGIALATNKTLDPKSPNYKWDDEGMILESQPNDDYNAIDPNYVLDKSGHAWLAFGSFWSGIKMRALDPSTGKLSTTDTALYSLAKRKRPEHPEAAPPGLPANWQAIEAPFIVSHGGYYYLFVSFDLCCRGTNSTYKTMVGRSNNITGPYVDRDGTSMLYGGGTLLLSRNAKWLGPGGESVLHRRRGEDLIVYHAYDHITGKSALQISTLIWNHGWPAAALQGP